MTAPALDIVGILCGNELWNSARLACYMDAGIMPEGWELGDCTPCPFLPDLLGETAPYTTPDDKANGGQNPAPWYDPNHPESANFAGLLVTDYTISAPITRPVTDKIGGGQVIGRFIPKGRTIIVSGWLIAKSCCAAAYGYHWLSEALLGTGNSCGCGGCPLCILDCCPTDALCDRDDDVLTEVQRGAQFWRTFPEVACTSGLSVLDRRGSSCGCNGCQMLKVQFTLRTGNAWMYADPTTCLDAATFDLNNCFCKIKWTDDASKCDDDCADPPSCLDDPLCPAPPTPPRAPLPANPCVCQPVSVTRLCCEVDAEGRSEWFEQAVEVEVYSGSKAMRNLIIRAYPNPAGFTPEQLAADDCAACSTLAISYIPPYGTLNANAADQSVTLTCGNDTVPAGRNVFQESGLPYEPIVLSCGRWAICVEADCTETAPDATVTIRLRERYL